MLRFLMLMKRAVLKTALKESRLVENQNMIAFCIDITSVA